MAYDEIGKKAALKYKKEKQHPVSLSYKVDEFEEFIRPAIERSGMPVATFVKKAIDEKINRDGLGNFQQSAQIRRSPLRIYLASPFFTDEHIIPLERAEQVLRSRNFDVFSPREHEARSGARVGTPEWSREIFEMDRDEIDRCDVMVMMFHGLYSDSGTSWECGYAYAKGKPVIVVHLGDESNLMVHEGSHSNIRLEDLETYDFENLPKHIYQGKMK